MTGFFRLTFYLFIAYVIYILLRFLFAPRRSRRSSPRPQRLSGMMVKDEMCNTYLPKTDALTEHVDGKVFYFCSDNCRRKFLEQKR